MLDSFAILSAMSGVSERDVVEAQSFLGYGEPRPRHRGSSLSGRKGSGRRALLIAAVVLLALGIVACSVYYTHWPQWLGQQFNASEEEKLAAEESGLSVYPEAEKAPDETVSATAGGVTITASQTIVDNYFAFISLRIEGYEVPEGDYMAVGALSVTLDGEYVNMTGGYVEGSYDNGAMNYQISLCNSEAPGSFNGKKICIIFDGLGTGDKGMYVPIVDGVWELSWTLRGSAETRTVKLGVPVSGSGVILEEAEISPISLRLLWKTDGIWDGFETLERFQPFAVGIRLKDGTVQLQTFGHGGREDYIDTENNLFEQRINTAVILEPEEIDALLFSDKWPWAEDLTADDLYIVELG